MELEVWGSDWGLPSVDPLSLAAMAYCKFGDVPVNVKKTNCPHRSPSGNLPVLIHKNKSVTSIQRIFDYIREEKWGTDFKLTSKQSADVLAFSAMVEEKLQPAILRIWWYDDKNFQDITRPWFTRAVPLPYKFFYPGPKRSKYVQYLKHIYGIQKYCTELEADSKIFKDAKECLNLLSTRLGKSDFYFGETPSSLDAIVYGYVAPLIKSPFVNNPLRTHLNGCDNLTQLCTRINLRYFPKETEESAKLYEKEKTSKMADLSEFPHKKKKMFLAGMIAFAAMVTYAIVSGIIQVEWQDNSNDDEEPAHPSAPPDFSMFGDLPKEDSEHSQ